MRGEQGHNPYTPEEFALRDAKAQDTLLAREFAWRIQDALWADSYEKWEDSNYKAAPIHTMEDAVAIVANRTAFDLKEAKRQQRKAIK